MPRLARRAWPEAHDNREALKAQYLLRCHALEQLSSVLVNAGLHALVVKGAALAATHYPEPWARAMGDIDVIVQHSELGRVRAALSAAGWRAIPSVGRLLTQEFLEIAFQSPAPLGSILLEIHLGLDKVVLRPIDVPALFTRANPLPGLPSLVSPSNEDHVLLVALHLASDEFRHLAGFVDLQLLLGAELDMATVVERARHWRASTALYVALTTLNALEPNLVSEETLEGLIPSRFRRELLSTNFNVGSWPVLRGAPTLGWKWIARQTTLRDDTFAWLLGLGAYAARRALERAR